MMDPHCILSIRENDVQGEGLWTRERRGDWWVDKRLHSFFQDVQSALQGYVKLKADGAGDKELKGKFQSVLRLEKDFSQNLKQPIEQLRVIFPIISTPKEPAKCWMFVVYRLVFSLLDHIVITS